MSAHYLLKLVPKSPFHLGEIMDMERTDVIIHSDTVFSALCNISDKFFGKRYYSELIEPFLEEKPTFLISSVFPYVEIISKSEKEEDTIYFFPKPLIFKNFVEKTPKNIKVFKKIQFVSKLIFEAYLTSDDNFLEENFQDSRGIVKLNNLIQSGKLWLSEEERRLIPDIDTIWKTQQSPRITIDRITSQTLIYHYSRVHYRKNAGLFLLIKILENSNSELVLKNIIKILRYLGDTGIGGERSSGNGQFNIKLDKQNKPYEISFKEGEDYSKQFITISLFLPNRSDIENRLIDNNSYYQIINRKGWISNSTYRRKSINMVVEGSVLNKNGPQIMGIIEEVTPEILKEESDYKIHRYGYSYPIYLKDQQN